MKVLSAKGLIESRAGVGARVLEERLWNQRDADVLATCNRRLQSLFSVVETALGASFALSARNASNFKYSLPHHQKVLEAIRRKRPQVARKAMLADSQANLQRSRGKLRKTAGV